MVVRKQPHGSKSTLIDCIYFCTCIARQEIINLRVTGPSSKGIFQSRSWFICLLPLLNHNQPPSLIRGHALNSPCIDESKSVISRLFSTSTKYLAITIVTTTSPLSSPWSLHGDLNNFYKVGRSFSLKNRQEHELHWRLISFDVPLIYYRDMFGR